MIDFAHDSWYKIVFPQLFSEKAFDLTCWVDWFFSMYNDPGSVSEAFWGEGYLSKSETYEDEPAFFFF